MNITKRKVDAYAGYRVPGDLVPFYNRERVVEWKSNRRFARSVRESPLPIIQDPRRYDALNEALAKLPVSQFVVVSRWAEGETIAEIARDFGVTHWAVAKKFVAGLERLRELLK